MSLVTTPPLSCLTLYREPHGNLLALSEPPNQVSPIDNPYRWALGSADIRYAQGKIGLCPMRLGSSEGRLFRMFGPKQESLLRLDFAISQPMVHWLDGKTARPYSLVDRHLEPGIYDSIFYVHASPQAKRLWETAHRLSEYRADVAVVGERESDVRETNQAEDWLCPRSTLKPFQAYALIRRLRQQKVFPDKAVTALLCSSHSGEAMHLGPLRELLGVLGLEESALQCGQINPYLPEGADSTVASQCSGNHLAFLWLARLLGEPSQNYLVREGRVQRDVFARLTDAELLAPEEIREWVTDGCGAPNVVITAKLLAQLYAQLALGEDPILYQIAQAMTLHPNLVGGSRRLVTELMDSGRLRKGDLLAKDGAGGILAVGLRPKGGRDEGRAYGFVIHHHGKTSPQLGTSQPPDELPLAWALTRTLARLPAAPDGTPFLTDRIRTTAGRTFGLRVADDGHFEAG